LVERISKENECFSKLKDPPYSGGYIVVVHTDEPEFSETIVEGFLANSQLEKPSNIDRAFLVLSYDPGMERCPNFELDFNG